MSGAPLADWRRVLVVGMSGSGKTTLSRELARGFGAAHIELDALFWDADWEPRLPSRFRELVAEAAAGERWVSDGNYSGVRDILWPRATAVVWLNLPFRVVFARVFLRTLRRLVRGERLWSGNRETLGRTFFSRESILWWVITTYRRRRAAFAALREAGTFPQLTWIELRSAEDVRRFREALEYAWPQTRGACGAQAISDA